MSDGVRHIEPKDVEVREVFSYLLGGVAPRPIALVSTLSADGIPNLSPFSFFNAFGSNPPTVAFAPSRRGRDATHKDTYYNLMATKECVVQCVTYDMVEQVNLASTEYPAEVNEFVKSGLTPVESDIVKPLRVAESPFQMECKLNQMVHLGDGPSSGNLAICEVLKFHIAERVFENSIINPQKIDLVSRMGASFYCRASGSAVFTVDKPGLRIGVGYDLIPDYIKSSKILTANNLGQLGLQENIPGDDDVNKFIAKLEQLDVISHNYSKYKSTGDYNKMLAAALNGKTSEMNNRIEESIKIALDENDLEFAWKAVLVRGRTELKNIKSARK
jgi:flavin reductase (DIM6/NTAB) family NADH-FMN oxidoreductase RutF